MHVVRTAAALLGLLAVLVVGAAPAAAAPRIDDALSDAVAAEINAARAAAGSRALTTAARLERSSEAHALAMAADGFFSHSSLDGTSFTDRIRRYYPRNGSRRYAVGETLYWSALPISARSVVDWWLGSSSHRATLLSARFRHVGVTAIQAPAAPGFFGGRDVTIVVVDYGVR
jgi:uncharacterized protein YkwD